MFVDSVFVQKSDDLGPDYLLKKTTFMRCLSLDRSNKGSAFMVAPLPTLAA